MKKEILNKESKKLIKLNEKIGNVTKIRKMQHATKSKINQKNQYNPGKEIMHLKLKYKNENSKIENFINKGVTKK